MAKVLYQNMFGVGALGGRCPSLRKYRAAGAVSTLFCFDRGDVGNWMCPWAGRRFDGRKFSFDNSRTEVDVGQLPRPTQGYLGMKISYYTGTFGPEICKY